MTEHGTEGDAARPRPLRGLARVALVVAAVLCLIPAAASAHAQLLSTAPANNAVVAHEPAQIGFTFGESVGIDGQAVRVFNSAGARVDTGATFHPGGRGPTVGVHLKPQLPHGTYTATYRVISADTHVVTGGFVFSIGSRSTSGAAASVNHLLAGQSSGGVTHTAFAVAHAVQYAAIGIALGLLVFALLVWSVALQRAGLAPDSWRELSTAYLRRVRVILAVTAAAGAVSAAAAVVLEAGEGRGISFWSAIASGPINDVLPTRFGVVWGLGLIAWLLVLTVLGLSVGRLDRSGLVPRPATLGATGAVLAPPRSRLPLAGLAIPLLALVLLPALSGHATQQHPVALFAPANIVHVASMSVWLGGLVGLLVGAVTLPAESGPDAGAGARILVGALQRFSPAALTCVGLLIVTGVIQALIEFSAWSQFVDTGYGRAVIVKCCALAALIGLGATQRRRTIPAVAADSTGSGSLTVSTSQLVRRTIIAELITLVVVLAAVGSLAESAPPHKQGEAPAVSGTGASRSAMGSMPGMAMSGSGSGAAQLTTAVGAAILRLSVRPAQVGQNAITLRLIDAKSGRPFSRTKQLTVTATLVAKHIGPLTLAVHRTGPGRYATSGAVLGAPGRWTLQITDRTSEFDESQKSVSVQIQ